MMVGAHMAYGTRLGPVSGLLAADAPRFFCFK
jgi:hypothetical protein